MKTNAANPVNAANAAKETPLQNVARILRNWKGSDATEEASPSAIAEQIDGMYQDYLRRLPAATAAIRKGHEESERRAA